MNGSIGIMATMHQKDSPLSSGRVVLWRTMPLLLISPILSSLLNGYDVGIYLGVGYGFLVLILVQYRMLCHEWMTWLDRIPKFTERDIVKWHKPLFRSERQSGSTTQVSITSETMEGGSTECESNSATGAVNAFREAVRAYQQGTLHQPDRFGSFNRGKDLVHQVSTGLPFIEWALRSEMAEETQENQPFSAPWFAQVAEVLKKRRQMVQGLKEHSIFMQYRYARLDAS